MRTITLEGKFLEIKEQAHPYLKEMLGLPEYYGENLDALYDCLTEMSNLEIHIKTGAVRTAYLDRVLHVFEEAAEENDGIKVEIR